MSSHDPSNSRRRFLAQSVADRAGQRRRLRHPGPAADGAGRRTGRRRRLPGAGVHLPVRRRRQLQHGGAAHHGGLHQLPGRAPGAVDRPGQPAADHAAQRRRRRAVGPAPGPVGNAGTVRSRARRTGGQRRAPGGADHAKPPTAPAACRCRPNCSRTWTSRPTACPWAAKPPRAPAGAARSPTAWPPPACWPARACPPAFRCRAPTCGRAAPPTASTPWAAAAPRASTTRCGRPRPGRAWCRAATPSTSCWTPPSATRRCSRANTPHQPARDRLQRVRLQRAQQRPGDHHAVPGRGGCHRLHTPAHDGCCCRQVRRHT